jgi:dipeptidyl aminopeptidase/acylaminoacyl peptidase
MKLSIPFIIVLLTCVIGLFFLISIIKQPKANMERENTLETVMEKTDSPYISPISIKYLRSLKLEGSDIVIEKTLNEEAVYKRYIASYISEGNKIYGLLTIPKSKMPEGGFPAIVFNHGYIPPKDYVTTERYTAYVDYLAKNGFVVFKIDFRGNGNSEGVASGSYFSSAYTIDAINALKSLQKLQDVNSNRIGMWGHSMSGNVVLRAMLVSDEIKAGVIWAGAVYSYKDFIDYKINDNSYVHRPDQNPNNESDQNREMSSEIQKIRTDGKSIDFTSDFWKSISLTKNINYLNRPLQIDHAKDDKTVSINYSVDLAKVLKDNNKVYEFNEYDGGGHNINSPYFEKAMKDTVDFFNKYLYSSAVISPVK